MKLYGVYGTVTIRNVGDYSDVFSKNFEIENKAFSVMYDADKYADDFYKEVKAKYNTYDYYVYDNIYVSEFQLYGR